jgi:hypothetical protein
MGFQNSKEPLVIFPPCLRSRRQTSVDVLDNSGGKRTGGRFAHCSLACGNNGKSRRRRLLGLVGLPEDASAVEWTSEVGTDSGIQVAGVHGRCLGLLSSLSFHSRDGKGILFPCKRERKAT